MIQTWRRLEFIASILVLLLGIASFGLALSSPVYTDEIEWKLKQGHFIDDGLSSRAATSAPSCGTDTFSTPTLLIPIRYLDALTTDLLTQPSDVRLHGLFMFLVWAGAMWWMLRSRLAPDIGGEQVVVGIVGTVSLGVMPLMMVMSRPEQVMLLGVSIFLILAMDERGRPQRSFLQDVLIASAMVVGSAIVLASHPRALLILPIAVLACVNVTQRRAISLAAGAAVTVFAVVAFTDFNARLACPGDATVRNKFAFDSIVIALANHSLGQYCKQLAHILLERPGEFFFLSQFGFNDFYVSQMIPPYPYKVIGLVLTALLAEFVGGVALAGMTAFAFVAMRRIRRQQGLVALAALASAWALPLVSIVARATRNHYEAELLEPLVVLVSVLSLWFAREELKCLLGVPRLQRYARIGFSSLLAFSIVSQIALLAGYAPIAEQSWSGAGYFSRQPFSVSARGYPGLRDTILAAAARCNISPVRGTRRLVVDELTYFAFRHTETPYLMSYLYPGLWVDNLDLPGLLARKRSSGVIVGCQWMVPTFSRVIKTNGFCCVPKF